MAREPRELLVAVGRQLEGQTIPERSVQPFEMPDLYSSISRIPSPALLPADVLDCYFNAKLHRIIAGSIRETFASSDHR